MSRCAAEVVATGIRFSEGPVWCPDGTLVCTSVADGALERCTSRTEVVERVADVGGGGRTPRSSRPTAASSSPRTAASTSRPPALPGRPPAYRPATPGDPAGRRGRDRHHGRRQVEAWAVPRAERPRRRGRRHALVHRPPHHPPPRSRRAGCTRWRPTAPCASSPRASATATASRSTPDGTPVVVEAPRAHARASRRRDGVGRRAARGGLRRRLLPSTPTVASTSRSRADHGVRVLEPDGTRGRLPARSRATASRRTAASAATTCARCSPPTDAGHRWSHGRGCRHPGLPLHALAGAG